MDSRTLRLAWIGSVVTSVNSEPYDNNLSSGAIPAYECVPKVWMDVCRLHVKYILWMTNTDPVTRFVEEELSHVWTLILVSLQVGIIDSINSSEVTRSLKVEWYFFLSVSSRGVNSGIVIDINGKSGAEDASSCHVSGWTFLLQVVADDLVD